MRKSSPKARIVLHRETLHALDPQRLKEAGGGFTTVCTHSDACTDVCSNPCTGGVSRCCP